MMRVFLVTMSILAGCGQDKIGVDKRGSAADYNHDALLGAVAKFVAAQRTPKRMPSSRRRCWDCGPAWIARSPKKPSSSSSYSRSVRFTWCKPSRSLNRSRRSR